MIIVKGEAVAFEMQRPAGAPEARDDPQNTYGRILKLPRNYGIIHDPDGEEIPRCECLIGPYTRTRQRANLTRLAKHYFGKNYPAVIVSVDRPQKSKWQMIGEVAQIFYERRGKYAAKYFHPFKTGYGPTLLKQGRFYRLALARGCIVDDRGFVFP